MQATAGLVVVDVPSANCRLEAGPKCVKPGRASVEARGSPWEVCTARPRKIKPEGGVCAAVCPRPVAACDVPGPDGRDDVLRCCVVAALATLLLLGAQGWAKAVLK